MDFYNNIQMRILLLTILAVSISAMIIPIETGSERCMVIYSTDSEDTIKIKVQFLNNNVIEQSYDYIITIKDFSGNTIRTSIIQNRLFKTEISVPNQTIYEACIAVTVNSSKCHNSTNNYHGEVLVDYQADTHFIIDQTRFSMINAAIKQEQLQELQIKANQLINATQQFIQLQKSRKRDQHTKFESKNASSDSLVEWWILELALIIGLGIFQWHRMKKRLSPQNYTN